VTANNERSLTNLIPLCAAFSVEKQGIRILLLYVEYTAFEDWDLVSTNAVKDADGITC